MKKQYRIICLDDPSEKTIQLKSREHLEHAISIWFDEQTGDGYPSVKEFQKHRGGIHQIQYRNGKGKWRDLKE